MATAKQIEANRKNARQSTGPKTSAGKAVVSRNAVKHGLSTPSPVLPGEDDQQWRQFHDGILSSLAPVGMLEQALAGRVASALWRLRRVALIEAAGPALAGSDKPDDEHDEWADASEQAADELKKALDELASRQNEIKQWKDVLPLLETILDLPDDQPLDGDDVLGVFCDIGDALSRECFDSESEAFLVQCGVSEECLSTAWKRGTTAWTAGMVRSTLQRFVGVGGSVKPFLNKAIVDRRNTLADWHEEAGRLEEEVARLRALQGTAATVAEHSRLWITSAGDSSIAKGRIAACRRAR